MKTAVKICGITDARGLAAAVDGGAAYIGLNFFRRSPRFVTPEQAAALVDDLTADVKRGVKTVGLFVDPTDAELDAVLAHVRLDMIQLHGKETPARVDQVRALSGLEVMKAIGVESERDVIAARAYENHADWLLFDAKAPKDATRPGGNAVAFNWAIMKSYTGKTPWMLAGGLTRANVGGAVKTSGARAVDVSSGVESKPGIKSPARIRAFLKAVAAASAGRAKG